ncbi:hypothetical protein GGI03_002696 [Coemansia sp. RSA 2337]|nr:hypothetical protein GGI14_005616 [Coemansia sp. S680]KAJ2101334.1 hypothetical protein GGI09_001808 [Coemansia sp. S100]KAJ2109882.1 hypothetical protein GGI16_000545 [Coemansia sp. S142-1]KAJ2431310.1 hypothetical protein GGF41_000605 [Coemansia sp. RSA 2531]KAJ2465378.1 hypothetical protein GGI03_002696 [Coemansia sp. RSA 2337]
MTNIEPNSKWPIYDDKDRKLEGLNNKCIIATGVFFYDVAKIAPSIQRFREALCCWDFEAEHFDIDLVVKAYGIEHGRLEDGDFASQELGSVVIKYGQCVVFPNTYQYKVPELKLANKTKPGYCKMLTFYFVDPSTRIPSTEIAPPQQHDWCFADVLAYEPFCRLPQLIVDSILTKVDFPILLKAAKKLHPQVLQYQPNKNITLIYFEPCFYFSA